MSTVRMVTGVQIRLIHFFQTIGITESRSLIILAIFIGLAAGAGAVVFRKLLTVFQHIFFEVIPGLAVANVPLWLIIPFIPVIGACCVWLITKFAKESRGEGVPGVMDAVINKGAIIQGRTAFTTLLASSLCIASGGSVGREGPIVQIGSSIGSAVGQFVRLSSDNIRILVGCGAAAGISAAFNAPIAGALFASEIILSNFNIRAFSPIIIASVSSTVLARLFLGNEQAFVLPIYEIVALREYILYALLGILCGIVSVFFIRIFYKIDDLFHHIRHLPAIVRAMLGGLLIGLIGVFLPQIFGNGYEAIDQVFANQLSWYMIAAILFFKMFTTGITLASGGSGGVFAPSLFLGAMTGGLFGYVGNALFPTLTADPGAYALVGMGAVMAGTTQAPLTAIILLFELTNNYHIILPIMLTTIIGSMVGRGLLGESIYTMNLLRKGRPMVRGRNIALLERIPVNSIIEQNYETIPSHASLPDILRIVQRSRHVVFPVVDSQHQLTGIITFQDIRTILFDEHVRSLLIAEDFANQDVPSIQRSDTLSEAFNQMEHGDYNLLPVINDANDRTLVGVITMEALMNRYRKELLLAATRMTDR